VLYLSEPLATASAEQAIRARAAAFAGLPATVVPPVHRIERVGASLQVTTAFVNGIRLSTLLEHLAGGSVNLASDALIELVGRVVRAVATLHAAGPSYSHGAIAPERIALTGHGVVLTDGLYATALEELRWKREHLWRTFGLALPSMPGTVPFDQRADVTELASVALALLLRRPLTVEDYPRAMPKLLQVATSRLPAGASVRRWLERAFQLHPRGSFAWGVDAHRAFAEITTRHLPATSLDACA